ADEGDDRYGLEESPRNGSGREGRAARGSEGGRARGAGLVAAFVLLSRVVGAQVGTEPAKSPFIDIEQRHEFTLFGGYFSAKKDPAKVAPQAGALGGLMYEWRASGPV